MSSLRKNVRGCDEFVSMELDRDFAQALNATLSEWNSVNDEEDFEDLQDI